MTRGRRGPGLVAAVAIGLALAGGAGPLPAAAEPAAYPETADTDVLYLDAAGWVGAEAARKLVLAAGFMRILCTDARMSPDLLVACLDRDGSSGPVFERSLACLAAIGRS